MDFEQIPWSDFLQGHGSITIMIAPIVIDELDKLKYSKNSKIASRAKKVLPKFEEFAETPSSCRYGFKCITHRPSDETFNKYQLNKLEQDDCLLATIKEFSNSLEEEGLIFLATNDSGPKLKSRSLHIKTVTPPEGYLLPNERDPLEKENSLLKKELTEIKNRIPDVFLSFIDKTMLTSTTAPFDIVNQQQYVQAKMAELKTNFPPIIHEKVDPYLNPLVMYTLSPLCQPQIDSYNQSLQEFYDEYEKYALSMYKRDLFKSKTIKLDLLLSNKGTCPAENIDVILDCNQGLKLFSDWELPYLSQKPKEPKKPTGRFDFSDWNGFDYKISAPTYKESIIPVRDYGAVIGQNRLSATFNFELLKHNQTINLRSVYVMLDEKKDNKSFNLGYSLKIANVPHMIEGSLNVKIT